MKELKKFIRDRFPEVREIQFSAKKKVGAFFVSGRLTLNPTIANLPEKLQLAIIKDIVKWYPREIGNPSLWIYDYTPVCCSSPGKGWIPWIGNIKELSREEFTFVEFFPRYKSIKLFGAYCDDSFLDALWSDINWTFSDFPKLIGVVRSQHTKVWERIKKQIPHLLATLKSAALKTLEGAPFSSDGKYKKWAVWDTLFSFRSIMIDDEGIFKWLGTRP